MRPTLKLNLERRDKNPIARKYILQYFDPCGYDNPPAPLGDNGNYSSEQFPEVAHFILETMRVEKAWELEQTNEMNVFFDWSCGLPCVLDTCYHYNRSAVMDYALLTGRKDYKRIEKTMLEMDCEKQIDVILYCELKLGEKEFEENVY